MTQETALAIKPSNTIIRSFDDASRAANAMAKSGYFNDSREAAQALVKILAGQEMGFGAFSAMSGIHIIQGRPAIGANLMAAAVKGSGRYNYRVTEMSDKTCSIKFYEHGEEIGVSTFTIEDAKRAQTKNLDKFPRNMLFARAMSNGVRWYCPDVFNGSTVYTPDELGAETDEEGNVINGQFTDAPAPKKTGPLPQPPEPPATVAAAVELGGEVREGAAMTLETAEDITNSDGVRYGDLDSEKLAAMTIGIGKAMNKTGLTPEQRETYQLKLDAIATILQARNGAQGE